MYQAAGEGDLGPLLGMLTEDITWVDSSMGPLGRVYHGKQQVPQFFAKMADVYGGTLRAEIAGVVAGDEHGIALTRESAAVKGEPVSWTGVHAYHFSQGRCDRFVAYVSAEYQRFWAG